MLNRSEVTTDYVVGPEYAMITLESLMHREPGLHNFSRQLVRFNQIQLSFLSTRGSLKLPKVNYTTSRAIIFLHVEIRDCEI